MAKSDTLKMDFFEKVGYTFSLWGDSWNAFKRNLWTLIALYLTPYLLVLLLGVFYFLPVLNDVKNNGNTFEASTFIFAISVTLVAVLLYVLLIPAITVTQLESVKGNSVSVRQAISRGLPYVPRFIFAAIIGIVITTGPIIVSLLLVLVLIGLLLLPFALVWAFLAAFFLFLVPYIIVNDNLSATDAIKKSYLQTKKSWHWVLAVFIVQALISVLSSIPWIGFLLGIVLGIIYLCLPALVYVRFVASSATEKKLMSSASPVGNSRKKAPYTNTNERSKGKKASSKK